MTIKRIGEHVFKKHEWTEEQLAAAHRVDPDFEPFDMTLMCGVDCMDEIFDLFGIDVFDWCDQQIPKQRPGIVQILERTQYVPEGGKRRTRREISMNWVNFHGEYVDGVEFLDKLFHALNSITGKDWHKRYAEALAPDVVAKADTKKKSARTPSTD